MQIRMGMWCVVAGRVGIVTGISDQSAVVDFVSDLGYTVNQEPIDLNSIAKASYNDIPLARRPTADMAYALGYL